MRFIFKIVVVIISLGLACPALAATPTCAGHVVIGEGDGRIETHVPNRAIHSACLNDQIVDTAAEGANYGNHGEFVLHLGKLVVQWTKSRRISLREAGELLAAGARSDVGKTIKVRVIAFNDFHGNIDGANLSLRSDADNIFLTNSFGQRAGVPAGGVDYMAGLVRQLKSGFPNNVVVSAGDLIGASPLNSALFHDEPTIETMNLLGLEFNAVGNHEFDEGREELLRMQNGGCHPSDANSCKGNASAPPSVRRRKIQFPCPANVVDIMSGTCCSRLRREKLQR